MEIGFKTDKGRVRSNNEDACYVIPRKNVFIVADGVGGSNSGEIANRTAVTEIAKYIETHDLDDSFDEEGIRAFFTEIIEAANLIVLENSMKFEQNRGMATTLVLSYINDGKAYICNVGDSRAYIFRNEKLTQITEDHTYVNSLVKAGVITHKEAETHGKKNMITRAVGADAGIEIDFFVTPIKNGDIIFMCTDGLYGELEESEIVREFSKGKNMGDTCCDLIEMANDNGGSDNITVVCLKIAEDDLNE